MHFAPESGLSGWIKSLGFENYATSDYTMSGVDYHSDLMDLPFDDNSIDFFICSHVLEHVEDDRAALQELFRVTRRGGLGILMVPIVSGLEAIDEDPCESDVAERWRRFGQDDHVRLYNRVGFLNFYFTNLKSNSYCKRTINSFRTRLTCVTTILLVVTTTS